MTFSTGAKGIIIFAADGAHGFSDAQIAGLDAITAVLTPVMDTYGQQHLARAIANRCFEVMSDAVDSNGGEILKFMGDGVLALFPGDGSQVGRLRACRQAIAAAQASHGFASQAKLPVHFGIGIHYGEVLYGNVGARTRIDFTVLGQSVNIASRVESFCDRLKHSVLVSDAVAQAAAMPTLHVATEQPKGTDTPMALHSAASS